MRELLFSEQNFFGVDVCIISVVFVGHVLHSNKSVKTYIIEMKEKKTTFQKKIRCSVLLKRTFRIWELNL